MGVRITLAGTAEASRIEDRLPETADTRRGPVPFRPWAWLPEDAAWYGIGDGTAPPRIWFVGDPLGLELEAFEAAVRAVDRRDGGLSPLARDTVRRVHRPPPVAVLTVPS